MSSTVRWILFLYPDVHYLSLSGRFSFYIRVSTIYHCQVDTLSISRCPLSIIVRWILFLYLGVHYLSLSGGYSFYIRVSTTYHCQEDTLYPGVHYLSLSGGHSFYIRLSTIYHCQVDTLSISGCPLSIIVRWIILPLWIIFPCSLTIKIKGIKL